MCWFLNKGSGHPFLYCACADTRKLIVTALELFQTLTTKARQAGTSAEGAGVLLLTFICCFAEMHVTF